MKLLLLHRSVAEGAAGATVEVPDPVARALVNGGAGTIVEDLGADPLPVLPVEVRLLRACSVNGGPHPEGATVRVSERDARLLAELGRAEIVGGGVAPVPMVDVGEILSDAARDRGPLLRPLGKVGAK